MFLGDFDREISTEYYFKNSIPIEIVHTPNQDKTDLEKSSLII